MKKGRTAMIVALCMVLVFAQTAFAETFTGSSRGFGGTVEVTIEVTDGQITGCEISAPDETAAIGGMAAEQLEKSVAAGKIEAVTGATMTSNAVYAALTEAKQAAGLAEKTELKMKPGTYTGAAHGFSCIDKVYVDVTVDETGILSLELEDTFRKDADSYENPYMCKGAFEILGEKIVENQSIGVDSVTGATGSSAGIKNAVRNALVQAYSAAGSTEEEAAVMIAENFMAPETKENKKVELSADVVVVGAGASGAIASLAALENGASVINVEKTFRWGGQSMLTGGPKVFSPATPDEIIEATVAEYEGIIANCRLGDDAVWNDAAYVAEHQDEYEDFNHDAYRAVIRASGSGAELLMDYGVQFSEGMDFAKLLSGMPPMDGDIPADMPEGMPGEMPADMPGGMPEGAMPDMAAMMAMEQPAIDVAFVDGAVTGSNINYIDAERYYAEVYDKYVSKGGQALLSTTATGLVYSDDARNAVCGVTAVGDDGTEYIIRAKNVVLATGGFGANEEMLDQYTPGGSAWIYYGWQGNKGDGINMAADAGAKLTNMDAYPMCHQRMGVKFITCFETETTEDGTVWSPNDLTVVMCVNPDGVYVNEQGVAFRSEEHGTFMGGFSSAMGTYNLGAYYYVVYSESQLEQYRTSGFAATPMGFQNVGEGIPANYPLGAWVDTVLAEAEAEGWSWQVGSLKEGDALLGLPEGTLEAAYDADPAQAGLKNEGSFRIIKGAGLSISSCGGVLVNADMQAVRADGSAIDGLYVVGNDGFGNIMATGTEYSIGGDAGMWCFGSGFIAGTNAAK